MIIIVEEIHTVKYVVASADYTEEQALQLIKGRKVDPVLSEFKELNEQRLARVRTIDRVSWWAYELVCSTGKFGWVLCSKSEV